MDFGFSEDQERMRKELKQFLDEEKSRAREQKIPTEEFAPALWSKMGQRGWIGIFVPQEYGGLGRSPVDFAVFMEALSRFGAPEIVRMWLDTSSGVLAMILTHGSPELKKRFLPSMCRGEISCSICWTEPDGGADGGMHTGRAVDIGDHFIVNATKVYNDSHRCTHTMLSVKTNPGAPRGKGHSLLMVDLSTPGITISPLWMMWGLRRDEVVFEDVKVPKANLIGEKDKGWDYWYQDFQTIEYSFGGNTGLLQRQFDAFIREIKGMRYQGRLLIEVPSTRAMIADIVCAFEVGRLLYYRAWTSKGSQGVLRDLGAAAMTRLYASEQLWGRMYSMMIDIIGQYGELEFSPASSKWPGVRLELPESYEFTPAFSIGGMGNEVARNTLASVKLGLPSQG